MSVFATYRIGNYESRAELALGKSFLYINTGSCFSLKSRISLDNIIGIKNISENLVLGTVETLSDWEQYLLDEGESKRLGIFEVRREGVEKGPGFVRPLYRLDRGYFDVHLLDFGSIQQLEEFKVLLRDTLERADLLHEGRKNALVVVNPKSGLQTTLDVYQTVVRPLLAISDIKHSLIKLRYPRHAFEIAQKLDLDNFDAAFILSGDGTIQEFLDGLWKHANPNAINFPFAPCPCGTGNVLSLQLGCNNVYLATLNFVRGNVTNRNGMLVTFQENPSLSYLIVTWAFLSDMAKATNGPLWRLFGKARYVGWILWKLIFSSPTEYPTRFWYWLNDEEEDGGTYHPCSPSIPGLAPAPPIKPQCVGPDDIAHYYEGPMSFFQCTVQRSVLTSFPKDSNHLHATVIMQNPRFWASFLTLQTYTIEAQEPNQSLREKFPEVYYWRVKALVMETLKDQSEVTLDGEEVQSSSKSTFAVELLPKSFYLIQPPCVTYNFFWSTMDTDIFYDATDTFYDSRNKRNSIRSKPRLSFSRYNGLDDAASNNDHTDSSSLTMMPMMAENLIPTVLSAESFTNPSGERKSSEIMVKDVESGRLVPLLQISSETSTLAEISTGDFINTYGLPLGRTSTSKSSMDGGESGFFLKRSALINPNGEGVESSKSPSLSVKDLKLKAGKHTFLSKFLKKGGGGGDRKKPEESEITEEFLDFHSGEDDTRSIASDIQTPSSEVESFNIPRTKSLKPSSSQYNVPISVNASDYVKIKSRNKRNLQLNGLKMLQELKDDVKGAIWTLRFSPCGQYLATAGQDALLRVWQISPDEDVLIQSKLIKKWHGHKGEIVQIAWAPKGRFLLSCSTDCTVKIWHLSREDCVYTFPHSDMVTSVAFHPKNERFFLSGSFDGKIQLWSLIEKKALFWEDVSAPCTAVAFLQDGKMAVAGTTEGLCHFYETEGLKYRTQISCIAGKPRQRKVTHIQAMPGLGPGEDKLLVTATDSRIRLYNLSDLNMERKYKGHHQETLLTRATFSADGRLVLSGSEDRHIYLWESGLALNAQGKISWTRQEGTSDVLFESFEGHANAVTAVECGTENTLRRFFGEGFNERLIIASADIRGQIRVWATMIPSSKSTIIPLVPSSPALSIMEQHDCSRCGEKLMLRQYEYSHEKQNFKILVCQQCQQVQVFPIEG